jgi:hypothetical protein
VALTLDGSKHDYTLTFPAGQLAAGQRLLVGDDVRRQDAAADRQPDQPLPHQLADAARHEEESGRFAHPVTIQKDSPGKAQGSELASRARTARSTW